MTLAARVTSNVSNVIGNISTVRFENFTEQWGGYSNTTTGPPNWGMIVQSVVQVYPDFLGQVAWLGLFMIPFMMMWVVFSDIVPVAIAGIFFGIYIFYFVGDQFYMVALFVIALSLTSLIVEVWRKWH